MVKNMQIESRQPSVQHASQSRRRSHRASSALTLLLAVQACSLGTVVSARPGVVIARSESATALSASTATISSSSSVVSPYQSNEARSLYRQAEVSQDQTSTTSYSTSSQSSATAIARSVGEFPTVTSSSNATSTATSTNQADGDAPVLLRQADPEPSASVTSSSSMAMETATVTSTSAAAFDVQPTATESSSEPSPTATTETSSESSQPAAFDVQPTATETSSEPSPTATTETSSEPSQPAETSTDDSKAVTEAENDGNKVERRDYNDDGGDSEDSGSTASGDEGSSSESCSDEDESDEQRQENVKAFPVASTLGQIGNTLPLKRYAAVYDAALTARSLDDFVESVSHSKRSWFDEAFTNPSKMHKDDGAMYSVMKRMMAAHQKQVDIHKRLLDLVASASTKRDHANARRQEDPTMTSSSPSSTDEGSAFPIVSNSASPTEEVERRDGQPTASSAIHGQWNEHDHQCLCTPSSSSTPSASASATTTTKRDDIPADQRHHQLLASAMSDWSFVSGWLSSRLPVDLHKQVIQALHESSQQPATTA
ncbi:uncharacterized protein FA14DRAFT_7380 [Meira miltonrushii]|uniref:Uncharacterized protein n=1 Tax=Meira miltonrushii TaxID=1280837 RepID=A0A316VH51_9BASI|nr:uncharacterized protein FA14DRAFT_7380 [Meira miltonrushii]PWN36850.1 hypothetical protein FA14DRAFT_7380 [Meira miltonrushii]